KLGRSVYNLQTRERALPHRGFPQLQCASFSEAESSNRVVVVFQTSVSNYSVPSGDAAVLFVTAKGDGRPSCFLNVTEFIPSASGGVHVVCNIRQCREALYSANEPARRQALGSQVLEGSRGSLLATSPRHSSGTLPVLPLWQLACSGRTPRVGGEERRPTRDWREEREREREREKEKELPLGGYSRVSSAGQAPPRGKPVCMDDVPILTDAKG
ncbi:hypothetical protein ALC60_11966, partial [Trachymyrmex zeteki]